VAAERMLPKETRFIIKHWRQLANGLEKYNSLHFVTSRTVGLLHYRVKASITGVSISVIPVGHINATLFAVLRWGIGSRDSMLYSDLFDDVSFAGKSVLRNRPCWINRCSI